MEPAWGNQGRVLTARVGSLSLTRQTGGLPVGGALLSGPQCLVTSQEEAPQEGIQREEGRAPRRQTHTRGGRDSRSQR